jgi:hypothetical protein
MRIVPLMKRKQVTKGMAKLLGQREGQQRNLRSRRVIGEAKVETPLVSYFRGSLKQPILMS